MVHEEVLLFVDAGGEAFGQGGFDGGVNGLLLLLGLGDGLLLLGAGLPPLLAPQRPPEVRVLAPVVVEVDYVSCLNSCAPCVSC